jgi:hypothetical protein
VVGRPKQRTAKPRVERVPVVIVLHPDGAVQVYGPRDRLDVQVVNMMDVRPEGEVLAERFAELSLPHRHRAVFLPGGLVAMGSTRDCRTPEQEQERLADLALVRAVMQEARQ